MQDLERLCNLAVSQVDQMLKKCAKESVSQELGVLGVTQSPKRETQSQRQAHARAATAQHTQCNLCLAKTLSWARDQGAAALCKSSESQCVPPESTAEHAIALTCILASHIVSYNSTLYMCTGRQSVLL